jgi:hypothetical protein
MPQSTPLDKIEADTIPDKEASDEERVSRIIQEMNSDGDGSAPGVPEMHEQQQQQQQQQFNRIPNSTRYVADPLQQPHPSQMMYNDERPVDLPVNKIEEPVPTVSKKNIWAHITDIFKIPVIVSVIFFVLSLPIVDVYLAKYASWAFSNNGTLNMTGLAVKALGAGAIMGVYETIDKLISRFL